MINFKNFLLNEAVNYFLIDSARRVELYKPRFVRLFKMRLYLIQYSLLLVLVLFTINLPAQNLVSTIGQTLNDSMWSPSGDFIATAQGDSVILWNPQTGEKIRTFEYSGQTIHSLTISNNGELLLAGGSDGRAILLNAITGAIVQTFAGHAAIVLDVAIAPDDLSILTAGDDDTAILWDVESGAQIRVHPGNQMPLGGYGLNFREVVFSPNGLEYFLGYGGHALARFDRATGTGSGLIYECGFDGCWEGRVSIAIAPDVSSLIYISTPNNNGLYNYSDFEFIRDLRGSIGNLYEISPKNQTAYSADGTRAIVGRIIYDTSTWLPLQVLVPSTAPIPYFKPYRNITFSPDGNFVLIGEYIWDATTGQIVRRLDVPSTRINLAAYPPSGDFVLIAGDDGVLSSWSAQTGSFIKSFECPVAEVFTAIAIAPDESKFIVGNRSGGSYLFNMNSSIPVLQFSDHTDDITDLSFSPDNSKVLTVGDDDQAIVYDATTGAKFIQKPVYDRRRSACFSPDSQKLFIHNPAQSATIYNLNDLQPLQTFATLDGIFNIAYSPAEDLVATTERYNLVMLWNASIGAEIHRFYLDNPDDQIDQLDFSDDGSILYLTNNRTLTAFGVHDFYRYPPDERFDGGIVKLSPTNDFYIYDSGSLRFVEQQTAHIIAGFTVNTNTYLNPVGFNRDGSLFLLHSTGHTGKAYLIDTDVYTHITNSIRNWLLGTPVSWFRLDYNGNGVDISDLIWFKTRGPGGTKIVNGINRERYFLREFGGPQNVYSDREYYFTGNRPQFLINSIYIQTLNDEKDLIENNFLQFSIDFPMHVYVALDDRRDPPPAWLQSWNKLNETLLTTDGNPGRVLYQKDFPTGSVTLGSNRDQGMPTGVSMYSVMLKVIE